MFVDFRGHLHWLIGEFVGMGLGRTYVEGFCSSPVLSIQDWFDFAREMRLVAYGQLLRIFTSHICCKLEGLEESGGEKY